MNIAEFRIELMKEAESFVNFWLEQQKVYGDDFPSELDENEWWEQFEAWQQVYSGA